MTDSELKALARDELIKILQSDSDKAFTAKQRLIQLVLTDQLESSQDTLPTEQAPDADYEESNVVPLVSTTIVDPTLEEKIKDAL